MAREGLWSVLSLDPSVNDCGFAGWANGALRQWGILHPPRALRDWRLKAASVRDQVIALVRTYDPLFVVAESPEEAYASGRGVRDNAAGTLRLSYLVGMLASTIHVPPATPRFFLEVTPARWKGRSPKEANLRRVNARWGVGLTTAKRDLDMADAIGVGHWFHLAASPEMLGDGLHAPCGPEKTALLRRALSAAGWRAGVAKATGRKQLEP